MPLARDPGPSFRRSRWPGRWLVGMQSRYIPFYGRPSLAHTVVLVVAAAGLYVGTVLPVWAEFAEGWRAYEKGDYARALREWGDLAEEGDVRAQLGLSVMHGYGHGLPENTMEAVKWYLLAERNKGFIEAMVWYRLAAEVGHPSLGIARGGPLAQFVLGEFHSQGRERSELVANDLEAVKWYRRAAEQGYAPAQAQLGWMYEKGRGVPQHDAEAVRWYQRAAKQGLPRAQAYLGNMYESGRGVAKDLILAHMWYNLAASQSVGLSHDAYAKSRDKIGRALTPAQLALAQQMAREWEPGRETIALAPSQPPRELPHPSPRAQKPPEVASTGSGFVVSKHGHALTNYHVISGCREVRTGLQSAESVPVPVLAVDANNDLALLKLASRVSRAATFREGPRARPGEGVIVVGYPLRGLLASALNVTTGTISALAGPGDDTRYLQITAPVQPGNSGGPLIDWSGNLIGVIVGTVDALRVARATGDIPQNVNFAIQASVARVFLDANAVNYEIAPSTRSLSAADIAEHAKQFTIVVECWK